MKISVTDGNLPNNVRVFFQFSGTREPLKKLMVDGDIYEIPPGEGMAAAVAKRQMEGEAVHIMGLEAKLGRLDVYSAKYDAENASRMRAEIAFKDKYGLEAMEVYNDIQRRKI